MGNDGVARPLNKEMKQAKREHDGASPFPRCSSDNMGGAGPGMARQQLEGAVSFFNVEPEASGSPAVRSPGGTVACVFDTWLGDDLIRAYPAVLVTTPVKRALLRLQQPTGFEITRARIRTSGFFRKHSPGKRLPILWAIQARGYPGRDDMGLTAAGTLVVSRRVLDVLLDFCIGRAVLTQFSAGESASRRARGCS